MDAALFISDDLQEREVELADGTKHTLHFKQLENTVFKRYSVWVGSDNENVVAGAEAKLIAASVFTPDNKPAMTEKQAARLKPQVMKKIVAIILEVNGFGDTEAVKKD